METEKSKPARKQKTLKSSAVSICSAALWIYCFCIALIITFLQPASSQAHGFAGKRFFPSTFAVEDPFVSDEFSILYGYIKEPAEEESPAVKASELGLEYSKRITPHFGLSIGEEYAHLDFDEGPSESGFNNLELGAKYQFFTSEEHEALFSFGVAAEIGDTGSSSIGAESFSVISPSLFFGKGFGDLPESMKYIRPFAVTGVIGVNYPSDSKIVFINDETSEAEIEYIPKTLTWGFTIQYDLRYLQSFVKDVGLGTPFNRMSLVVEFPMETCLDYECDGDTTGYVNPGLVWNGKKIELGLAARIPVNSRTGDDVGVYALLHFFIDDIFPNSLGRPIFP
jgi:hypothetical protein